MNAFDYSKNGAIKLLKNGKGIRALKYFTEALQYKPLNVDCLVSRSYCYLNDGNIDKAEIDANLAYESEPKNPKAIYQKAEVHYFKGEFETALLYYHQGHALRPDDKFRVGIQRAETGIRNCVGDKNSFPINTMTVAPIIAKAKSLNIFKQISQDGQIQTNKRINCSKTIKALLKEVSTDRINLEKIIIEEDIRINKLKDIKTVLFKRRKGRVIRNCFCNFFNFADQKDFHSRRIKSAAEHCMHYLEPRIEFWQQHKPFYTRGKKKKGKRILNSIDKDRPDWTIHNVLLELVHIEMLEYQGDYWKVIEKAKKIISKVKEISGIGKHNYNIIISDLYSIIGNCFMKVGSQSEALEFHELDRTNGLSHNIKDAVSRSMDYIGIIHATKSDYQSAIKIWSSKIKLAVSNVELAWLYHEIGRCYFTICDFENALKYAFHSLEKANLGMDENWQLNANILIGKIFFNINRFSESTESYIRALELSKILKLTGVEEELNKLIQDNLLKPKINERSSLSKIRESVKTKAFDNPNSETLLFNEKSELYENSDSESISEFPHLLNVDGTKNKKENEIFHNDI